MKKSICFFLWLGLLLAVLSSAAQSGKLPPFRITQANGKLFKAEDLPMGRSILIVYFSPDCDHCQAFMNELKKRQADFKKFSIVFITFLSVEKVAGFVNDYKIHQYANMYAGTEGSSFFVRHYYKIREMPYIAMYDKDGRLLCSYEKDVRWEELMARVKAVK